MQAPDASFEKSVKSHDGVGLPTAFNLDVFDGFDHGSIVVEPVEPVDSNFGSFGGKCLLLRNVLTPEECRHMIHNMSTAMAMEPVAYRHEYRRNDRCVADSPELAEVLWRRIRPIAEGLTVRALPDASQQHLLSRGGPTGECPHELRLGYGEEGIWRPVGLNECFRFCRYKSGGFFRAHCDGRFRRSEDEQSLFTCMFYLDGQHDGGATRFLRIDGCLTEDTYLQPAAGDQLLASVPPEAGSCILFFQPGLLHEGEDLRAGEKHILRTDVMFRRDADTRPRFTPEQAEARSLLRQAEEAEAACECDRAVSLYRRAFRLDPRLERMC